ncbi:tannase/feruloyl esterase family alpha/beta hydrolase [Nguyenibacter sp. L1]|uniref:tannase/feruloyl esterase family alpha/beta hydrolase n=1 Tax=Nguyenibacter sp. L1 TaxID=3049350 RepID=UPI002B498BAF|nr:tannase/feruloyl esterase family alpha/beta hydrolase [Nguyenibacter sp. L1]WRH87098.1 tannase/feruloyl esterase family alpha/beta hydrolase [Nguyenibacter sp. L1]
MTAFDGVMRRAGGVVLLACLAGSVAAARAAVPAAVSACAPRAIGALHVADVTVAEASAQGAACVVTGRIRTHGAGAPDGSAGFRLSLPRAWNARFLMLGVGGFAGNMTPSANGRDIAEAAADGYAVGITDTGHADAPGTALVDGRFALDADGHPDRARLADYDWRATHQATSALKALVARYYGARIDHAYFDGCSNGGRQGMIEAERFPGDYDGIIAGDPFLTLRLMLGDIKVQQANLAAPDGRLRPSDLALIDRFTLSACDALDGRADGLIQNPALCHPDFDRLLCRPGQTSACLAPAQVRTARAFVADTTDRRGGRVYPGFAVGHWGAGLAAAMQFGMQEAGPPAGATWPDHAGPMEYQFDDQALKYLVMRDPSFSLLRYPVGPSGIVPDAALAAYDGAVRDGNADDAGKMAAFLKKGGKIIFYHGYADMAISPYSTIDFFNALQAAAPDAARGARLFMVPGMAHCGGGVGPDRFDTLSPLDRWVATGQAPARIEGAPSAASGHAMPLCAYPAQARAGARQAWACR